MRQCLFFLMLSIFTLGGASFLPAQTMNLFWQSYEDPANSANDDSLILDWWSYLASQHSRLVMLEGDDTTRRHTKHQYSPIWQSMWYQTFTTMTSDPLGKPEHDARNYPTNRYGGLKVYIAFYGGDLEQCFLHNDTNYTTLIGSTWYFQGGWSEANDVGGNNIRDKKGYGAFPVSHGLNYAVFSDFGWTVNSLVGMGVYTNEGRTLVDTVTSNTADTVYWNVGDTINKVLNAGFETGFSSWVSFGDSTNKNIGNSRKIFGDSSRLILNDASGVNYIWQKSLPADSGWSHRFRMYYRTNSSKPKLTIRKGSDVNYVMYEFKVPAESANMARRVLDTLIHQTYIVEESAQVMLGFESTGVATESLIVDSIKFTSHKGFLNAFIYSWQSPPDSARYGTVIDSFSAVNHTAIAYDESLSRSRFNGLNVWMTNPNYGLF